MFGAFSYFHRSLKNPRSTPAPPFIMVAWRIRDRLFRFPRSLCDKGTFITIFDFDSTRETSVLSEFHASSSADRVVLPSTFPCKRNARLRYPTVYVSKKNENSQSIIISRDRNQSLPDDFNIVVVPLRRLYNSPPTIILIRGIFLSAMERSYSLLRIQK